ncbi:MAG: redoxin domain-containing protein [Candidatus Marinimicrobia bacterium]|nr:redoxin domain-containing protein [Candidatus Neomarinimicrobiota bacterium]
MAAFYLQIFYNGMIMILKNQTILLFLVLSLIVICNCENTTEPDEKAPAIDFKMETVDGDTLQLSDTFGKIVILQFMQWDCDACQAEVPVLNQIYQEYSRDEVILWSVSFPHSLDSSSLNNLKNNFIDVYNPKYPILIDNRKYTSVNGNPIYVFQAYEVTRTPTTVIIDKEGFIRFYYDDSTVPKASFDEWIKELK